ncbi:hypothetical protein [Nocardia huaxiensis]|uniref:hypothetical protein n=1 Tax=Nocardia huaxiensis TaxID=2755382 RepID=UPI001E3700C4|nr:hypothetical protein [Nocardia huaxiensis]UFS96293.1 hypothetical protein LPY97_37650 [Nocardia huaxiensis]
MVGLSSATRAMVDTVNDSDSEQLSPTVRAFIEIVTFAGADEILSMIRAENERDWMGLPVWARNLSYRLACLQRPDDSNLIREAAGDLFSFGPDWDGVASQLVDRAEELER